MGFMEGQKQVQCTGFHALMEDKKDERDIIRA